MKMENASQETMTLETVRHYSQALYKHKNKWWLKSLNARHPTTLMIPTGAQIVMIIISFSASEVSATCQHNQTFKVTPLVEQMGIWHYAGQIALCLLCVWWSHVLMQTSINMQWCIKLAHTMDSSLVVKTRLPMCLFSIHLYHEINDSTTGPCFQIDPGITSVF